MQNKFRLKYENQSMASSVIVQNHICSSISLFYSPKRRKNQTLTMLPSNSPFLSHDNTSVLKFKKQSLPPNLQVTNPRARNSGFGPVVFASQSDFLKVIQTVWRVGKDGVEAGANMLPDSVPRPIARISVAVVLVALSLFVLKSFLSTAFFVLAMMGAIYFIFIALNKDQGPKQSDGTASDDPLEEAERIMEKYK